MALIVPEESQRPYRFGMTLVCIGALFNWLGLADHHTKPVPAVRYIGVGLVASGAVLICMAMCFWMNSVRDDEDDESIDHIHVISLDPPVRLDEKPPDYASVVDVPPPSYDDAIKLDPQRLMDRSHRTATDTCSVTVVPPDECDKTSAGNETAESAASQPTAKLAQAIRKSIRDIRKQLTNTVSDGTAADVEQQQHQQSGSAAIHCTGDAVPPAALRKSSDAPATV
uniref:Transmembrane protein n=1 Tax=Schizaphis graminum TaxID=13262 RepID=A0A2S2NCB7_SCHGA